MNIITNFSRYYKSDKKSVIINMLSLIPGLASSILIITWIVGEVNVDSSLPKSDRIVRVKGNDHQILSLILF